MCCPKSRTSVITSGMHTEDKNLQHLYPQQASWPLELPFPCQTTVTATTGTARTYLFPCTTHSRLPHYFSPCHHPDICIANIQGNPTCTYQDATSDSMLWINQRKKVVNIVFIPYSTLLLCTAYLYIFHTGAKVAISTHRYCPIRRS